MRARTANLPPVTHLIPIDSKCMLHIASGLLDCAYSATATKKGSMPTVICCIDSTTQSLLKSMSAESFMQHLQQTAQSTIRESAHLERLVQDSMYVVGQHSIVLLDGSEDLRHG